MATDSGTATSSGTDATAAALRQRAQNASSASLASIASTSSLKSKADLAPQFEDTSPELANYRASSGSKKQRINRKYRHVAAVHSKARLSCLSHDFEDGVSFVGFRNLMVLVLVVGNLRLMIENFSKYGVLICFGCHDYRRSDLLIGSALLLTIPMHLFIAYTIEVLAARQATRLHDAISKPSAADQATKFRRTWILVAWAHFVNASAALAIASTVVYFWIHHPLIGTSVELHAIIVWLKTFSYALTNRDLRHAYLHPSDKPEDKLPELYAACSYPRNISIGNLCYFWWAPTLVYQPVYPRTPRIRKLYVLKRLAELATLSIFIWILTAQYAAPLLRNSLLSFAHPNPIALAERTMKLSTISLVTWLAGFFALFQSALNALAEVMRFADRDFYADWWNAASVGAYWRMWNKPVYTYMKRHVFSPLRARGCSPFLSSFLVFFLSAVLHELLVGVPTHMFIGVAFLGMMAQLPLIALTEGMERWGGRAGKTAGNCVFWVSFVLVGQPLAALIYFFAWEARFGGGIDHLKAKGTAEVSGWTGGWGSLFR